MSKKDGSSKKKDNRKENQRSFGEKLRRNFEEERAEEEE